MSSAKPVGGKELPGELTFGQIEKSRSASRQPCVGIATVAASKTMSRKWLTQGTLGDMQSFCYLTVEYDGGE